MFSQYGESQPSSGWDRFTSLGHPNKFQRVSRVGFVTSPMSLNGRQPNFAWCLAVSWAGTLIFSFGSSCPQGNFARRKIHFASKSCVILYWQRYCAALELWASAKLCGMVSSRDRAAIPFDTGRSNCLALYFVSLPVWQCVSQSKLLNLLRLVKKTD